MLAKWLVSLDMACDWELGRPSIWLDCETFHGFPSATPYSKTSKAGRSPRFLSYLSGIGHEQTVSVCRSSYWSARK